MPFTVVMVMITVAGCTRPSVITPKPVTTHAPVAVAPPILRDLPFGEIVDELQLGRYSDGERDLRHYLASHPGDRPAQALLRQLTVDPQQALGARSRSHVVQHGDSYSTLAARYLGNAGSFLILARYNHSDNPSLLRAGDAVRLPLSSRDPDQQGASDDEPLEAKAERLQRESLSLLDEGRSDQAMARLDQALSIEPRLKPSGLQAAALREQLLASWQAHASELYHARQTGKAIALWNRILAVSPNYKPAVDSRAHALRQQHTRS